MGCDCSKAGAGKTHKKASMKDKRAPKAAATTTDTAKDSTTKPDTKDAPTAEFELKGTGEIEIEFPAFDDLKDKSGIDPTSETMMCLNLKTPPVKSKNETKTDAASTDAAARDALRLK